MDMLIRSNVFSNVNLMLQKYFTYTKYMQDKEGNSTNHNKMNQIRGKFTFLPPKRSDPVA